MQKIKNVEDVVAQVKSHLRNYLEEQGTEFRGPLMTCPNRDQHAHGDRKPSAGFIPDSDETAWNCFSCGQHGDIFNAYAAYEGKDIEGQGWYLALQTLADRLKISYELEPLPPEEQEQARVQQFLQALVNLAHSHLLDSDLYPDKPAWDYIDERGWREVVRHFRIGYVARTPIFEEFFKDQFGKFPEITNHISMHPDQFYNRIIYPVQHMYGSILGIMTRSLADGDSSIKYQKHFLKSLEKGGALFNLTKEFKTVYIVEGGSSVFTLYKNGIQNVVALNGKIFSQQMYNNLIKAGVDRAILCFDGDDQGQRGMESALTLTQDKSDIKILIKTLPEGKDPDDIVKTFGATTFNEIPEVSNFKFQLERLKTATDLTYANYKKSVFDILTSFNDSLIQDKMTKMFMEEMNVSKTTFSEELQRYKTTKSVTANVEITDILAEEKHLLRSIELFEEQALRCGKLKGIPIGFPILEERLDGLQNGLILIAGKWNTGKTAFLQSLALNILKDPSNFVLFFSIDDPTVTATLPRMMANLARIPINTMANPINRIDNNETIATAEKLVMKERRAEAIALMKSFNGRLGVKDSTDGYDTTYVEKTIKIFKSMAGERQLVVIVDFLNMVKWPKNVDRTEQETQLAFFFKHMANVYQCPVVCTVEANKGISDARTKEADIKGSSALSFRSTLTLLLSSDFEADGAENSEMYFYDDNSVAQPIVRLAVSKNKGSGSRKALFYKFYRDFSRFEECTPEEQDAYKRKFK